MRSSAKGVYDYVYREIMVMALKKAKSKPWANKMIRKADLVTGGDVAGPRTVIDAYVDPLEANLARQYATDLSDVTQIRLASRSDNPIYVRYTTEPPNGVLNPEFSALAGAIFADSSGDSGWVELFEEEQAPVRLVLSTQEEAVGMNPDVSSGPFAVLLQVR